MNRFLLRLFGCILVWAGAAIPLLGQPFNWAYFNGDPDNEVASVRRTDDGGFVGVGHFAGAGTLFKLRSDGGIDWARNYGPVRPVAVRPVAAGGFAWIGNVPGGAPVPVFVLSNGSGALTKAFRFTVPGTGRAEVTALEIDIHDASYWIGGNAWRTAELQMPWIAHFSPEGQLLSIGAFLPPDDALGPVSARIESLVPTIEPGVIAVGRRVAASILFSGRSKMLALRLNGEGKLLWSQAYFEQITQMYSEQWLVAVTRDPRSASTSVFAVGKSDKICGVNTALPCAALFTAPTVIEINEASGAPNASMVFSPRKNTVVFNPTAIVRDGSREEVAVGGSLDPGTAGGKEAVLVRAKWAPEGNVLGAETFGDGRSPFVSEVADLSFRLIPKSPVVEPGYVLANRQSVPGTERPTIVTTDDTGRSDGTCERAFEIIRTPSLIAHGDVPLDPKPAAAESYILNPVPQPLSRMPCLSITG
jgi:hypothetical protein